HAGNVARQMLFRSASSVPLCTVRRRTRASSRASERTRPGGLTLKSERVLPMHEELSLELLTPTVRLVNESWAGHLQNVCAKWKAAGARRREDGTRTLVSRLKESRPSTYQHCVRVARHSRRIGVALGFDEPRLKH